MYIQSETLKKAQTSSYLERPPGLFEASANPVEPGATLRECLKNMPPPGLFDDARSEDSTSLGGSCPDAASNDCFDLMSHGTSICQEMTGALLEGSDRDLSAFYYAPRQLPPHLYPTSAPMWTHPVAPVYHEPAPWDMPHFDKATVQKRAVVSRNKYQELGRKVLSDLKQNDLLEEQKPKRRAKGRTIRAPPLAKSLPSSAAAPSMHSAAMNAAPR